MVPTIAYTVALIASALWFAAAFRYFSWQHSAAAKVLIPRSARSSPIFMTTAASVRFLGGMNGAFCALSAALLVTLFAAWPLFTDPLERAVLLSVLGLAHFSQFIFNVPILLNGERQGETYWYVKSGPMLFIFVIDALETVVNLMAAAFQFL